MINFIVLFSNDDFKIIISISFQATEHFVKILEIEVHEATLILALENFSLWASKFGQDIPVKFVEWIPKGMALKSSTPAVRSAYLLCLYAALGTSINFDQVITISSFVLLSNLIQ